MDIALALPGSLEADALFVAPVLVSPACCSGPMDLASPLETSPSE